MTLIREPHQHYENYPYLNSEINFFKKVSPSKNNHA